MSWVRLDDGSPGHRKIVGLSDAAFRLWVVGLTYCNQQANDGRFSAASARPAPNEPPKSPRAGESDFQRQIRESRERGEIT